MVNKRFVRKCQKRNSNSDTDTSNADIPTLEELQAACLGLCSETAKLVPQIMEAPCTLRLQVAFLGLCSVTAKLIRQTMEAPSTLRLQAACLELGSGAANLVQQVIRAFSRLTTAAVFWVSVASHAVSSYIDDSFGKGEKPGIIMKLQGLAKGLKFEALGDVAWRNVFMLALAFYVLLNITATSSIKQQRLDGTKPSVVIQHRSYLANCTNNDMLDGLGEFPDRKTDSGILEGLKVAVNVSSSSQSTQFTMATHLWRHDFYVSKYIHKQGCFDCELWNQTISTLAKNKDAFLLDIGSNIGIYGLSAAAMGVDVYAFEPFKKNWRRICQTIKLNPGFKDRITLFQTALSSKGPQKISYHMANLQNPAALQISPLDGNQNQNFPENAEEGVDYGWAVTLDSLQDSLPKHRPVVIDIDVEGHECEVFAGGMNYLNQLDIIHIMMKISPKALSHCNNRQAIFNLFTQNKLSPTKWVEGDGKWVAKPLDVYDLTESYEYDGGAIEWARQT